MSDAAEGLHLSLRDGSRVRLLLAGWVLTAICILAQGVAEQLIDRGAVTGAFLLRWRLFPIALWGAAIPLALAAARRWPVPGSGWAVHVARHGVVFASWMLLSNVLLRIPDLLETGTAAVGREALAAAIEYAPAGALAWALLVAVERFHGRTARAEEGASGTQTTGTPGGRPAPATAVEDPLSLKVGYRTHLVPRDAIRWVEADGDYVRVHTEERVLPVRSTMKAFQERLGHNRFVRIHRSTLVSVAHVREVQPYFHGDYVAVLRDGTELRIPRSRRRAIRRLLGSSGD